MTISDADRLKFRGKFLGLPNRLSACDKARAWVLPVPYEATTCYGTGTRNGPAAIIAASVQVELYDQEFGCEPVKQFGVHTTNPLNVPRSFSPEKAIRKIEEAVADIMAGPRPPASLAVLGGEHSISAGVVRGIARGIRKKDDLVAVHIDAHADLRDEFQGSRYSHACAARRILDTCPIFQIGVRSMSIGEALFCKHNKRVRTVFSEDANAANGAFLRKLAAFVRNKRVFLTIDLDGLDPSIMPAVGTPEPGGISWERLLEIVNVVCRCSASVPAFDVVELSPIRSLHYPDFLAAKLVYKIMSRSFLTKKSR
jgi:agmatinase